MNKRLVHVGRSLAEIDSIIRPMTSGPDLDRCLLEQLEEQLNGLKLELFDISRSILALDIDTTELTSEETMISKGISRSAPTH